MFFNRVKEGNVIAVVYRTLSMLKVRIRKASVSRYLQPHPDYPSLKSVCDLFKDIHVDYYPLRIDEKELFSIQTPFIAHCNEEAGKITLIYKISNKRVVYADLDRGKKEISTDKFLDKWSGVVILLELTEKSGEQDYYEKRKDELAKNAIVPFVIFLFCFLCVYGFFRGFNILGLPPNKFFILALTKSVGLIFSLLLFQSELDIKIKFTDKLCHIATNVDCYAVTRSGASKIFGGISWADMGITYFSGGLILLFILPFMEAIAIFSILSVAALPYPIYSVLYQGFKIKKWCPLCLSVQAVLICEFILLVNTLFIEMITLTGIGMVVITFSIILAIVLLIKFLYISNEEEENSYLRLMKMKRNPAIFLSQVKQGKKIEIPESSYPLIIGEKESKVTITVFLSFYCTFCAKKYKLIKALIDNDAKVKIRLIFGSPTDELSTRMTNMVCSMMERGETNIIPGLVEKWYDTDQKQKNGFLNAYQTIKENKFTSEFIFLNSELFKTNKIDRVPAVFVNSYPLPKIYELEDIMYFIDEIEDELFELKEVII